MLLLISNPEGACMPYLQMTELIAFPSSFSIDQTWAELVNALSGLFCASLNFMDNKATVMPRWSFRPAGLASEYYSFDSRFMRYSAQPGEIVCTENLTPWSKLLPCENQV